MEDDPAVAIDAGSPRDAGSDAGSADAGLDPDSDIGEPCDAISDCRAAGGSEEVPACLSAETWPNGTAWQNGYCAAACAAPPPIQDGVALGRGDCPPDALCTPLSPEPGAGVYEGGICLRACSSDADCRVDEGYFCRRSWGVAGTPVDTPNGVCMAWHCRSRGCPSSAICGC